MLRSYTALVLIGVCFLSFNSVAGDKVGNGGGLWVCHTEGVFEKLHLVDLYEAEHELLWSMKTFSSEKKSERIVEEVVAEVQKYFPTYSREWLAHLRWVQKKKKFVRLELEKVDDALFRTRPPSQACPNGLWEYKQLANFTHILNDVIISEELWNHPRLSETDRAGLLWHEAIYYWFRTKYQDSDSTRARYVTGLLFSQLTIGEKKELLRVILKQDPDQTPPPSPDKGPWMCVMENSMSEKIFAGYGKTQFEAKTQVEKKCKASTSNFACHDYGGFEYKEGCEEIKSTQDRWVCRITEDRLSDVYLSQGRSLLEAMYKVSFDCLKKETGFFKGACLNEPECIQKSSWPYPSH